MQFFFFFLLGKRSCLLYGMLSVYSKPVNWWSEVWLIEWENWGPYIISGVNVNVGNVIGDLSLILQQDCLFCFVLMTLEKAWIYLFSLSLMVKSSSDTATSLVKGELWIQTCCSSLKNWPCIISYPWQRVWIKTWIKCCTLEGDFIWK